IVPAAIGPGQVPPQRPTPEWFFSDTLLAPAGTRSSVGRPSLRHDEAVELLAVGRDLPHGQGPAVDVRDGQRVDRGDELMGDPLPGVAVLLLLGVVEVLPAGAGDDVEHPLGRGVGPAVELLIEEPPAVDEAAPRRLAVPAEQRDAATVGD